MSFGSTRPLQVVRCWRLKVSNQQNLWSKERLDSNARIVAVQEQSAVSESGRSFSSGSA
jgi:hypothetical protein